MFGGVDISTGDAFTGTMRAPGGSTVITPLTTLVAAIVATQTSPDVNAANAIVAKSLGLDSTLNLTTFDPIAATLSTDTTVASKGKEAIAAAIQVQNTILQTSAVVESAAGLPIRRKPLL